ncbi:winged helix-turn-helix domain-containing protein [Leifsonia shinshuensis]|uniref:ArsR/SmtB family transcription factor n=1 Tax=Leifsonia shinshuensis TaxID=150026 RepID=UPI00285B3CD9|nr:winged helix-turn-helix domain-containing protein [Leifsonia shinshuensis]MDR6970306.1 DNA-binding transcriptional ArsR family regulator [Leifsonia shinshuensis]
MTDDLPHASSADPDAKRRPATPEELKALSHPLRVRIVRLCGDRDWTNKQLADRLGIDPGTVYYHVRQLVRTGFLEPADVRTGESGALEKPYRSTGKSWWLTVSLDDLDLSQGLAPVEAFQQELAEAGPTSIATYARFSLHLSPEDVAELDRRIVAVLDEFIEHDAERAQHPAHGGIFLVHRALDPGSDDAAASA